MSGLLEVKVKENVKKEIKGAEVKKMSGSLEVKVKENVKKEIKGAEVKYVPLSFWFCKDPRCPWQIK